MSHRISLRSVERWLGCLLLCGLMIHLHTLPVERQALADDPPTSPPDCLPLPIPPEIQEFIDTTEEVYAAIFTSALELCTYPGLLLDEPLDGSLVPGVVSGHNSGDEPFDFELVDGFELDFSLGTPEEQALLDEWGTIAGMAAGQLFTQLGSVPVMAAAVSMEVPDHSAPRLNLLIPLCALTPGAWEALELYAYGDEIGLWNPCGQVLDEAAQGCLRRCREDFNAKAGECTFKFSVAAGVRGVSFVAVTVGCGIALASAPATAGLTLPIVGACIVLKGPVLACVIAAALIYDNCLDTAATLLDTCIEGCCAGLEERTAGNAPNVP